MQVERRGEGEKTMMERAESATASALMRATSSRLHVWSTNVLDKSTPANSHITPNNCHQLNTTRTQLYTRNSLFLVGTPVLFFVFFVFVFFFKLQCCMLCVTKVGGCEFVFVKSEISSAIQRIVCFVWKCPSIETENHLIANPTINKGTRRIVLCVRDKVNWSLYQLYLFECCCISVIVIGWLFGYCWSIVILWRYKKWLFNRTRWWENSLLTITTTTVELPCHLQSP